MSKIIQIGLNATKAPTLEDLNEVGKQKAKDALAANNKADGKEPFWWEKPPEKDDDSYMSAYSFDEKGNLIGCDHEKLRKIADKKKSESTAHIADFDSVVKSYRIKKDPLSFAIDHPFTNHDWPYGLTGRYAQLVYNRMVWPNKEIAIISARHVIGALQGRKGNLNGLKPQMHTVLLSFTGTGKETINKELTITLDELIERHQAKPGYDINTPILFENIKGSRGSYGVRALVYRFMQAPSLSVLLGEAGVKDKSDAGSVHDVKAFMLSNLVNAPYSRIDTKDYAEGIPDVIGTVFQLTEESTLQSYKQKFKLEGLHSGDFARQQVIFVNPCAMEKEVLAVDEEAIYEELMALGEWCVFGENALFTKPVGKKLHTGCCLEATPKENRVNFVLTNEAETLRKKMYIEEHLLRTKLENFETNEWSMQSRFNAKVLTEALQYAQTEYSYEIKNNADAAPVITLEMLQEAFKFVTESDRGFKANFDLFNAKAELVLEALVNHLDKKFKGKKMVLHREIVAGNSTFNRIVKREATEREPYSKLVTQAYEMGDDLGYWVHLNKNSTLIKRQEHGAGSGGGVILVLKTVR